MSRETYRWNGKRVVRKRARKSEPTVNIVSDYQAYDCPVTGKIVEGRAAHRENLKRTGCRLLEKGESREFQKNQQREADRSLESAVSRAVESIAHQL